MWCTCAPRSDRLSPVAINPKLLTEGESVIIDTRTHWKAVIWPAIVLVAVLVIAGYLIQLASNKYVTWILVILGLVALAVWSIKPFLDWLTATYTITTKRLITREGLISRRGHDIPLLRISDVAYDMGPLDRLLGCGTLVISDASTHGQVELHDIPDVETTQHRLMDLLGGLHAGESGSRDDD
jgi:membrane protein YdbS with pleckstrin-like domain